MIGNKFLNIILLLVSMMQVDATTLIGESLCRAQFEFKRYNLNKCKGAKENKEDTATWNSCYEYCKPLGYPDAACVKSSTNIKKTIDEPMYREQFLESKEGQKQFKMAKKLNQERVCVCLGCRNSQADSYNCKRASFECYDKNNKSKLLNGKAAKSVCDWITEKCICKEGIMIPTPYILPKPYKADIEAVDGNACKSENDHKSCKKYCFNHGYHAGACEAVEKTKEFYNRYSVSQAYKWYENGEDLLKKVKRLKKPYACSCYVCPYNSTCVDFIDGCKKKGKGVFCDRDPWYGNRGKGKCLCK